MGRTNEELSFDTWQGQEILLSPKVQTGSETQPASCSQIAGAFFSMVNDRSVNLYPRSPTGRYVVHSGDVNLLRI